MTTEDGYNLSLLRLTADSGGNALDKSKGPLLFIHGAFSRADDWLLNDGEGPSIAVQWANDGYDVWIGSARGSEGSRTTTDPGAKDPESADLAVRAAFWDFTVWDIGLNDVPAFVDKVQKTRYSESGDTACEKVQIVAHGTGVESTMIASERIEGFADRVNKVLSIASCPVMRTRVDWFNGLNNSDRIAAVYSVMSLSGVPSLIGDDAFAQEIATIDASRFTAFGIVGFED